MVSKKKFRSPLNPRFGSKLLYGYSGIKGYQIIITCSAIHGGKEARGSVGATFCLDFGHSTVGKDSSTVLVG